MIDVWSQILDWLKQPPRIIAAITIAAGIIALAPNALLTSLKIDAAVAVIGPYIGITFILGCSLLLTSVVATVYSAVHTKYLHMRVAAIRNKYLHDLTVAEKSILRYYISQGTKTQRLPVECGEVQGLEVSRIIARVSTISRGGTEFDYNIQPWAWKYLQQNQHLIEAPRDRSHITHN